MLRHGVVDGLTIREHLPEIEARYTSLRPIVAAVSGESIVGGLHPISDINLLVYRDGSVKGAHFDTVPVSLVLFLTTHPEEDGQGALYLQTLEGRTIKEYPRAGDGCLLQGKKVLHWVKCYSAPPSRVVVNANYYTTQDTHRDAGIDIVLYS